MYIYNIPSELIYYLVLKEINVKWKEELEKDNKWFK